MAEKKKTTKKAETVDDQRQAALQTALDQIEKRFGQGTVMRFGDKKTVDVDAIPSGSIALDRALGIGGIPRGRITEIFGPESSGKTTVALHVIAEAQKRGGVAAFIDAEHALDPVYAKVIGVDIDNLLVSQPDSGEQALEVCDALVRSGAVDIVVIDSVAALTPKAELEGEMGDTHVGLLARLMSQALRKLTSQIGINNTAMIFINQVREKIGGYGNPEVTPGGRALKFATSVRLEVRRGEPIKRGTEQVGSRTRVKVVKNKVAPPFRTVEFDIIYGEGISKEGSLVDVGVETDVVTKSGSWFSFGDVRLGQGRDNARLYLKENPEVAEEIERLIRASDKPAELDLEVVDDKKEENLDVILDDIDEALLEMDDFDE